MTPAEASFARTARQTAQNGSDAAGRADRAGQAEMGFEPMNNGFAIRPSADVTNEEIETSVEGAGALGALLGAIRTESPDLATVIESWSSLPAAVRAGIIAMVKTTTETTE